MQENKYHEIAIFKKTLPELEIVTISKKTTVFDGTETKKIWRNAEEKSN